MMLVMPPLLPGCAVGPWKCEFLNELLCTQTPRNSSHHLPACGFTLEFDGRDQSFPPPPDSHSVFIKDLINQDAEEPIDLAHSDSDRITSLEAPRLPTALTNTKSTLFLLGKVNSAVKMKMARKILEKDSFSVLFIVPLLTVNLSAKRRR